MDDPPFLPARRFFGDRAVLLVTLTLAALSAAPYVRATVAPPPGTSFIGYFWFTDDAYNYLSFVQQAEDGALAFRNRLVLEPHAPALVNPEWSAVGMLSRLLGRRPILAYRLFAVLALFGLVAGIRAWLADAGLPETHAAAALALVCLGGGAGAIGLLAGRPVQESLDISTGLFPFLEILANPHFVTGTALLLWAMRAFGIAHERGGAREALAAGALGSLLALTRPYDLVVLVAIRSLVVVLTDSPARWLRHALAMALLLPVVAYDAWVFYRVPAFSSFTAIRYVFPAVGDFARALGPPAAVAAIAWAAAARAGARSVPAAGRASRVATLHFAIWLGLAAAVIAARPVNFSLQFLVGAGLPLLCLAALALAAFPPVATIAATAALSSAAVAAAWITLQPNPAWYAAAERVAVARALRAHCDRGDVVLAPPDIGRYASGFSSCTPWVSHPAAEGFEERSDAAKAFYDRPDRGLGAALVARSCAAHVVLPAAAAADAYLGAEAPRFRRVASAGAGAHAIAVYSRDGAPPCAGR
jgi:hypothetical protein